MKQQKKITVLTQEEVQKLMDLFTEQRKEMKENKTGLYAFLKKDSEKTTEEIPKGKNIEH